MELGSMVSQRPESWETSSDADLWGENGRILGINPQHRWNLEKQATTHTTAWNTYGPDP
jgi:hypothetical protein